MPALQVRFNLPVWLGIGEALEGAISAGDLPLLQEMCQQWPFFKVWDVLPLRHWHWHWHLAGHLLQLCWCCLMVLSPET